MESADILNCIDAIERSDFLASTESASTHNVVASMLRRTPEVQYLCEQKEQSLPLLLERYNAIQRNIADSEQIVYFVLFGMLQDKRALPLLIAYLQACRDRPVEEMLWPWHPFLHAIKALSLISAGQIDMPKTTELLLDFGGFLARVDAWNKPQGQATGG